MKKQGTAGQYIKAMNRLIDYYQTDKIDKARPKSLSLQQFKRFPVHPVYEKMDSIKLQNIEGLQEPPVQPRIIHEDAIKCDMFIKETLKKMIDQNEKHIRLIEDSKNFYLKQSRSSPHEPDYHVRFGDVGKRVRQKLYVNKPASAAKKVAAEEKEQAASKLANKPPRRPDMIPFKVEKTIEESSRTYLRNPNEILASFRSKKVGTQPRPPRRQSESAPKLPSFPKLELAEKRGLSTLEKNVEELVRTGKKGVVDSSCHFDHYEQALSKRVEEMRFDVQYEYEQQLEQKNNQFRKKLAYYFDRVSA